MLYQNEIDGAKKLVQSIKRGTRRRLLISQPQTGKSNIMLGAMQTLKHLMFVIVTPIRELNLFKQNQEKLETDNSKVVKLLKFKTLPNPKQLIEEYSVNQIFVDETHFGSGVNSHYHQLSDAVNMIDDYADDSVEEWIEYANEFYDLQFTMVSATPFALIQADFADEIISLPTPKGYCGAEWMLDNANLIDIEDISENGRFNIIQHNEELGYDEIQWECYEEIAKLQRKKDAIGLIRVNSTNQALALKAMLETNFKTIDTIVIGGNITSGVDYTIDEGIEYLKDRYTKIKSKKGRTILICIGSLRAGADLKACKKYINLIIEPSNNLAAVIQGLLGRAMGYNMEDRQLTVICRTKYLEAYVEFIHNPNVVKDDPTFFTRHNINNIQTHYSVNDGLGRGRRSTSSELAYIKASDFKTFDLTDAKKMFKWLVTKVNDIYGARIAKQLQSKYENFIAWSETQYTGRVPQLFDKYSVASRNTAKYSDKIDGKQIGRAIAIGNRLVNKEKLTGVEILNQFFTKGNYEKDINVIFTIQNNPKLGKQFILAAVVSKDKLPREQGGHVIHINKTFMAQ